jgi:flavin reductase (DIM6/NTAB) family NADH-FMN oxidoreductase RutF
VGAPLDVTNRHITACCAPLVIGVSMGRGQYTSRKNAAEISLRFHERGGHKRLLGVIRLEPKTTISLDKSELILFNVLGSSNYCLPRLRLWAHYLPQAYLNWRKLHSFDVKMTSLEIRASQVAFIRPHPLMLGSIAGEWGGNIFPMNLLGDLGNDDFAFALKDSRRPAHLVERAGCIAVSNVPLPLCSTAFRLAINHTKQSIDWDQLSFALKVSKEFRIPVPISAPRVREMTVNEVHKIGSHTLFIARIVSDERFSNEPQVNIIHGFYQHWRLGGYKEKLRDSLIEDSLNKRGQLT